MELNNSAQELLTRAQMLRLEQNADDLAPEHILCVLLEAKNDPSIDPGDVKALNNILRDNLKNVLTAQSDLTARLRAGKVPITAGSGMDVVGLAGEMAEDKFGGVITPAFLADAIFEQPTEIIRSLMKEKQPEPQKPQPVQKPEPVQKPQPAAQSEEDSSSVDSELLSALKELAVLQFIANAIENQSSAMHGGRTNHQANVRRKTKLGPFTYRGGPVAAAIQYFAFGILVPFLVLVLAEHFTGCVSAPKSPFVGFLVDGFIVFAAYYLLNGAALLLGLLGNAFGNFLQMLCKMILAGGLAFSIIDAKGITVYPTWVRILLCVAWLLILLIHNALYEMLKDEGSVTKTKIMFREVSGSAGKVFFKKLGKTLILPLLVFSVVWITGMTVPRWLERTFMIALFLMAYSVFTTMWVCLSLKKDNSRNKRGRLLIKFFGGLAVMMEPPVFLLYLHKVFAWSPVRVFVWIILGLWTAAALILSLVLTLNEGNDMML